MADMYTLPYMDSSVFIGWIKGEVVKGVDRGKTAHHILTLAERGDFKICTSTLTLAEVHKKRRGPLLSEAEDEELLAFFEHPFILRVDVDRQVGEKANEYCRAYGLLPNDGIHLACAIRAGCDVLLAWDTDFSSVANASIRFEEHRMIGQQLLDLNP